MLRLSIPPIFFFIPNSSEDPQLQQIYLLSQLFPSGKEVLRVHICRREEFGRKQWDWKDNSLARAVHSKKRKEKRKLFIPKIVRKVFVRFPIS